MNIKQDKLIIYTSKILFRNYSKRQDFIRIDLSGKKEVEYNGSKKEMQTIIYFMPGESSIL